MVYVVHVILRCGYTLIFADVKVDTLYMPCPSGAPPPCRAARTTAAAAFILAVWQLRWKGWIRGAGLLAV